MSGLDDQLIELSRESTTIKLHYGSESFPAWKLEVVWKDGSTDRFEAGTPHEVVESAHSKLYSKKLEHKG